MKQALTLIFVILFFQFSQAQEKIFENEQLLDSIEVCIDHIYNYQFDSAEVQLKYIRSQTNNHVINPFLYGLFYYWKSYPLTPENEYVSNFIDSLHLSIELSQKIVHNNKESLEGNFILLTSRALLMMYYGDNGIYIKAIEHVYPVYKLVMKSFNLRKRNNEFNYYTGIYNYYREKYPKAHPIYKPVVYFLRKGDTKKGLEELQYAAENCIFMDTEAYIFLVIIYLNYENNPEKALKYAKVLYNLNENNRFFLARYIELKLVAKDSAGVEELIQKLFEKSEQDDFTTMLAYIYKGMYEERFNENFTIALYDYKKGLKLAEKYNSYANNFKAYAFLGLSRIYKRKEKKDLAEMYFEKAEDIARYDYYFEF